MTFLSSDPPSSPNRTKWSNAHLALLSFGLSCVAVAVVVVSELASYSKSGKGELTQQSVLLIFGSPCALVMSVLVLLFQRRFSASLAVLVGAFPLLPVLLMTVLLIQELVGTEAQDSYADPRAVAYERAQVNARAHPYVGRDSTNPYFAADQMPSLTGRQEYHPQRNRSYTQLAQLLGRNATATLGSRLPAPDTVTVSFNVGPYGGVFQPLIEYEQLTERSQNDAEDAVLRAVHYLPRLRPGRINNQPISVRIFVAVPLPMR